MKYRKPASTVPDRVDLYCCRNIDCGVRLRAVPEGSPRAHHCGIPADKFATVTRKHWNWIQRVTAEQIYKITSRQKARRIKSKRADCPAHDLRVA